MLEKQTRIKIKREPFFLLNQVTFLSKEMLWDIFQCVVNFKSAMKNKKKKRQKENQRQGRKRRQQNQHPCFKWYP